MNLQIGMNLKRYRGEMSQVALAEKMTEAGHSWAQATVWSVEQGKRPLKLNEALTLAEILGVSLIDLAVSGDTAKAMSVIRSDMQRLVAKWEGVRDALTALQTARAQYGLAWYTLGEPLKQDNIDGIPAEVFQDFLDYFNGLTEWSAIAAALSEGNIFDSEDYIEKQQSIVTAAAEAAETANLNVTLSDLKQRLISDGKEYTINPGDYNPTP